LARLRDASDLARLGEPHHAQPQDGSLTLSVSLPRQGVSLLECRW
jgi:hypothetical protein